MRIKEGDFIIATAAKTIAHNLDVPCIGRVKSLFSGGTVLEITQIYPKLPAYRDLVQYVSIDDIIVVHEEVENIIDNSLDRIKGGITDPEEMIEVILAIILHKHGLKDVEDVKDL